MTKDDRRPRRFKLAPGLTARAEIDAHATAQGWRIVESGNWWDPQHYDCKIGRKTASITVMYDIDGAVLSLSGARDRQGCGGWRFGRSTKGKRALVIERLDPQWWTARDNIEVLR